MDNMDVQGTVPENEIPDEEVIARVLNGEKRLYALIVRKYNQRLYRIAMSILDSDAEAEDVMQTAYLNAYEHLASFGFRSSFATWLTRIAINEGLLRLRKSRRAVSMSEETMNAPVYQRYITDKQNPAMQVLNSELKNILEDAIRKLPEKYRTVFVMREVEGMNVSETGDCLNITAVNVKVRLNRAKSLLRTSLSSYYKKEDIFHFHLSRCDRVLSQVMSRIEAT